jgi:hypothetical protein
LWVHGEAEHHGGKAWRKATHLMVARRQRTERARHKICPAESPPPNELLSPSRPHFLVIMSLNYESINGLID